MKTFYWILTAGLVLVLMSYSASKDRTNTCQPPQVAHRDLT